MPPRSDKEIVFFLTNVGITASDGNADFFEKSKEVMKLITEKKIFLRPKDEVGIMLVGHNDPEEDEDEKYTMLFQPSQIATWEMVENISDMKPSRNHFVNWPRALEEVFDELKQLSMESRLILILLFDCDDPCPDIDCINWAAVVKEFVDLDIRLLWIGSKSLIDLPAEELNESESLLKKIVEDAEGKYMPIDETLHSLKIFKNNKARFMPWKCALEIGDLSIPTATYVQAKDDAGAPSFRSIDISSEGDVEKSNIVRAQRDFVDRHREAHPITDTISGYMFGRKFIPVSEADEAGLNGMKNIKCFDVLGFVKRDDVGLEDLAGDSSRIVVPDGPLAAKPFYSLARAMDDGDYVAIVRRVYSANSDPKLNALIPSLNDPDSPSCFILLELTYSENRRFVQPVPLNSALKILSKEQEEAVEDFIDAMMLTKSDDKENDLFASGKVPSPGLQHLWNSVSHRALNPEAPLPPMIERLRELLQPPESIKANVEPALQRLRELFPIEKKEDVSMSSEKTTGKPDPELSETVKHEPKIEENLEEPISRANESNVDLDELFEAEMDM